MTVSRRRIRAAVVENARPVVRGMAARRYSRSALNWLYSLLSPEREEWFHGEFAKIFRNYKGRIESGEWKIAFCGKPIVFPLAAESAWLDWDAAVSALGHDREIKSAYEVLLKLEAPPRLFLDVGANFGTHSILFLVHNVKTISFEPNPGCHGFFKDLCARNHVQPEIEAVAISDRAGLVDLWFPESEEWLGTTRTQAKDSFQSAAPTIHLEVPQITLDSYVREHSLKPHLIKIDTEGNELNVLQGCSWTLSTSRPLVIFEVWPGAERQKLLQFFSGHRYRICNLPITKSSAPAVLSADEFDHGAATNFIAIPQEMLEHWPPRFDRI